MKKYSSFVIYGITSRSDSFNSRMVNRNTMKKITKIYNSQLFYFIGKSRNDYYNELINIEERLYNDIIQMSFYESYFNLTIMTIMMIKWITKNCNYIYFVKNDEDVVPNMRLLYMYLNNQLNTTCSYGILSANETVCRIKYSKNYIPLYIYKKSILPRYLYGYFSIYYNKLLCDINKISYKIYPIIYKEDVHVGLLAAESRYSLCKIKLKIVQAKHTNLINVKKYRENIIAIHGVKKYREYFEYLNYK